MSSRPICPASASGTPLKRMSAGATSRWADVSPASDWISPGALSPGARCDGPTSTCPSTSACWPTVLLADGVALRNRCPQGQADPRAAIAGGNVPDGALVEPAHKREHMQTGEERQGARMV